MVYGPAKILIAIELASKKQEISNPPRKTE
jgi:hypothetical protein